MPASGVVLERLALNGLPVVARARLPAGVVPDTDAHAAPLVATLSTPRGVVLLESPRPSP